VCISDDIGAAAVTNMDLGPLLERLQAHRTIGAVPLRELEWLANAGTICTYEPREILTSSADFVAGLFIVLDGHLSISVNRGTGSHIVMEWRGGDVTGVLPYSRVKRPPGDVIAEARTTILSVDAAELPRLIRECPELTAVLVHVMLDRARAFKSSELLDEKMASLGRLAAGLAHELNNPASAVARSAKTLVEELEALDRATECFCALHPSDDQRNLVTGLRDRRPAARAPLRPLELADRRDAVDDWLSEHGVEGVDAAPLVDAGLQPPDLEQLGGVAGMDQMGTVLTYISTGHTVRRLAAEIEIAASRIHALVAAVKGFTYLNQQATLQPIAIRRGLEDTVTVLGPKAKSKSVSVEIRVPERLPDVDGYGGELNQVWANLLDNAIDATPGGHVRIEAASSDEHVMVRVIDDGPGIPADVLGRIFDPFFTTKDVGEGTGLGLDIARRIVQRHRGAIDVSTGPGGTEFRVTLPAAAPIRPAPAEGAARP
jgi:signal transduction histidine kinase